MYNSVNKTKYILSKGSRFVIFPSWQFISWSRYIIIGLVPKTIHWTVGLLIAYPFQGTCEMVYQIKPNKYHLTNEIKIVQNPTCHRTRTRRISSCSGSCTGPWLQPYDPETCRRGCSRCCRRRVGTASGGAGRSRRRGWR